ncbi:hypothetical protein [Corynebacterium heidelbergense]|uniref:Uncharacterized protein n=1 Tax=Corynebacterium heidelbergense TaxID=2055947 RepID=A0A364V656_9CORY|nr:hypothetical protein [Corynebacterium heidelbergense]RAV32125.1 hypothetical protein DLJ54_04795 [Corynebacterium heidelbergense]
MARSLLVTPELDVREMDVDLSQAPELLGGSAGGRLHVAFVESGQHIAAVYSEDAMNKPDAEPNPLASMGRNESDTGNARFLSDPTRAIAGPVLFVGREGEDLTDEEVESVHNGIRAVENYRADNPEEFQLWHDAVLNLHRGV